MHLSGWPGEKAKWGEKKKVLPPTRACVLCAILVALRAIACDCVRLHAIACDNMRQHATTCERPFSGF